MRAAAAVRYCRYGKVVLLAVTDIEQSSCPRCEGPIEATISQETGDQLAFERIECPHCGAQLVRDVEGHADRGWRLDDQPRS